MSASGFGRKSPNSGSQNFQVYMYSPDSSQKGKGKGKVDPNYIHAVRDKDGYLHSFLRAYPDQEGNCVLDYNLGPKRLQPAHILAHMSSEISELHRRPAFGVSFVASSVCALVSLVRPLPPNLRRVLDKDDRSSVLASLVSMQEFFTDRSVSQFLKACTYLNCADKTDRDVTKLRQHLVTFFQIFRRKQIVSAAHETVRQSRL